jgi:hypothetical protein
MQLSLYEAILIVFVTVAIWIGIETLSEQVIVIATVTETSFLRVVVVVVVCRLDELCDLYQYSS